MRKMRQDLEMDIASDFQGKRYDLGDIFFQVHRGNGAVTVELDVFLYPDEPSGELDESFSD